jgi:alkyl hydroperoxide reductase subunit AhpC
MSLQLGDTVPDFTQDSQLGSINFYDYAGDSWVVLFSHPADYTPVCTTELGEVAKLRPEWEKRNVKTIALSVDSAESHKGWIGDINDTQYTSVDYPILADADKKVSDLYGMIHPNALNNLTVRSVFIIDPNKKLRLQITYPASTGRNFDEILRVIDLSSTHRLPPGGHPGELERWRRLRRGALHPHRRSPHQIPQGCHRDQALPAHDSPAQQINQCQALSSTAVGPSLALRT